MLTVILRTLVADLADVDGIGQQIVKTGLGERLAAERPALAGPPAFTDPAPPLQFLDDGHEAFLLTVERKDGPHAARFRLIDHQLGVSAIEVVAQKRPASRPLPFAPGCS